MKAYGFNGLAGCVEQRRSRQTGTMVGVYHGAQAGMEDDPASPWLAVCEEHGTNVCNGSIRQARFAASNPREWCNACRPHRRVKDYADQEVCDSCFRPWPCPEAPEA